MNSEQLLKSAMTSFRSVEAIYKATGYGDSYQLNFFWANQNLTDMRRILEESADAVGAIQAAGATYMFSVNSPESVKEKAVDWHLRQLSRMGIDVFDMPASIQESEFSNSSNTIEKNGRRLTPDFFRHFNAAVEINKYCLTEQRKYKIVELGAGMGDLCRLLRLFHRDCCYVIVDIAETLCFSYMFLRLNFPEAKVLYVTDASQLTNDAIDAADFIFVPTMFSEVLARTGTEFDLFVNTASLGEMKNAVIRYWMDFIQAKLRVKNLFTVNRFLNTIIPGRHDWRLDENECSVLYDARWRILNWELEPPFTRCPYVGTLAARSLEIAAERSPADAASAPKTRSRQLVLEVMDEDWVRLDPSFPPEMTYRDNILVNDLTMSGTLFKLWDSIRLDPNELNVELMLKYLRTLMHRQDRDFEETFYYDGLLSRLKRESAMLLKSANPTRRKSKNEEDAFSVEASFSPSVGATDPQEGNPLSLPSEILKKVAHQLQLVYRWICPRAN